MLRSILFYLCCICAYVLAAPILFIFLVCIKDERLTRAVLLVVAQFILFASKAILKLDYTFEGLSKIKGPSIIASKHQSMWETLALFVELDGKAIFIIKKELARWPLLGRGPYNLNFVMVDKKNTMKTLKEFTSKSKAAIEKGLHVIIFPEGTRTNPGENVTAYSEGVCLLYKNLGLPVAAVALNSGCFWPPIGFVKNKGTITAKVVTVIQPGLSRNTFYKRLTDSIELESKVLAHDHINGQRAKAS